MIAWAAIDLRGGRAVQLVGGRPEEQPVSLREPVTVARRWLEAGFNALHVIDLDAALGTGSNQAAVEEIVAVDARVQVGGGLRTAADVARAIGAGADRAIVGTRAVSDTDWLRRLAEEHPERIVAAADLRDRRIVSDGWRTDTGIPVEDFLDQLEPRPLAGVLVTDVGREGRVGGVDAELFAGLVRRSRHAVQAAGGIASIDDLRELAAGGLAGAVIGMALYTGAVDPAAVAEEFDS